MDDFFDDCDGFDFWDWGIVGGLSEELARERRDKERARREPYGFLLYDRIPSITHK